MLCIDRRAVRGVLAAALALLLAACAQANPDTLRNLPTQPPPVWVASSDPITLDNVTTIGYLGRLDSPGPAATVFAHSISPDSTRLVGANNDQLVIWDLITGETVTATARSEATRVFFGPDKTRVFGLSPVGVLSSYDAETGRSQDSLSLHPTFNDRAAYASDDGWLAVGGLNGAVRVWDLLSGEQVAALAGHTLQITHLALTPDGRYLASASEDNRVIVWDWQAGEQVMRFDAERAVTGLALAADGQQAAVAHQESVRLIDIASGDVLYDLPTGQRQAQVLRYAPDRSYLITGTPTGELAIWDTASGELVARLPDAGADRLTATFSPDSTLLLTTARDARASLWNMTTLSDTTVNRATLDTQAEAIFAGDWTPDGRMLLLFGSAGPVYVWGIAAAAPTPTP